MAIADFILSCGLPFRIADHPKFRYMCESVRSTSNEFKYPNRNIISTDLMNAIYESSKKNLLTNY